MSDEIPPDGLEGADKIGALVWCGRPEVGGYIEAVLGADNAVLIFVGGAVIGGEGFGEPVGGADKGCLRVDILSVVLVMCFEKRFGL